MDQPEHPPTYRVPDDIAWVDGPDVGLGEELYLTVVPEGRTVLLKDTARLIWLIAAEGGEVLTEIATLVGRPAAEIEPDVQAFLADLTARGLLVAPGDSGVRPRSDAPTSSETTPNRSSPSWNASTG